MKIGAVEPIEGEPFRFRVKSFKNPARSYLVDIAEHNFVGQCDCPDWICRVGPAVAAGKTGVYCKHVEICRQVALDTLGPLILKALEKPI